MKRLILIIISLLCFAAPAWSATWYVTSTGSAPNGDGSIGDPWQTYDSIGWGSIDPGDTLDGLGNTFREGIFNIGASGTLGNPITITNLTTTGTSFETTFTGPDGNGEYTHVVGGALFVTEDGLRMTGGGSAVTGYTIPVPGSLNAGEWAFDSGTAYIKPSSGVAGDHTYEISKFQTDGIRTQEHDYLTFDNITVYNSGNISIFVKGSDYVTVENSIVYSGIYGIRSETADYFIVRNNLVYDTSKQSILPGEETTNFIVSDNEVWGTCRLLSDARDCSAINVGASHTSELDRPSDGEIKNNYIHDIGHNGTVPNTTSFGIQVDNSSNIEIAGNTIENIQYSCLYIQAVGTDAPTGGNSNNVTFYNNILRNCSQRDTALSEFKNSAVTVVIAGPTGSIDDFKFYNNTIVGGKYSDNTVKEMGAIFLSVSSAPTWSMDRLSIVNNIFQDIEGDNLLIKVDAMDTAIEFANNIIYNITTANGVTLQEESEVYDVAHIIGTSVGFWTHDENTGVGNLTLDPLFVNAASDNYGLTELSPARGAGTPVGLSTDFCGFPIPADKPDMGAYQTSKYVDPVNSFLSSYYPGCN